MRIKRRQLLELGPVWPEYSSLVQRLYMSRGLDHVQANTDLSELLPYDSLLNIEQASLRLMQAMFEQQRILIIGDFDADGATATAVAVSALRAMGAKYVDFMVPNRFTYGYGLTVGIVEQASALKPDLIITVDNGISNIEGVNRAKSLGMDVLITDHHLAGEILPAADVIVNPNQPHDQFPSKAIAGVGVIFYVLVALRKKLQHALWFEDQKMMVPNMAQFLDLVALGTVADVVPLDRNNRIMVKYGLRRIQQGLTCPGIVALIKVAGRSIHKISASDLAYALAPRLNAAGRLDDMSLGIHCLLTKDLAQATHMAQELDELNIARRKIEMTMQDQALSDLRQLYHALDQDQLPAAICLYDAAWHQGVIGILAGRLKDKFKRPSIIFAQGESGELKGSARSVAGVNIRDVLTSIDSKHPGLLIKFGGHAMAAGMTIAQENFLIFSQAFVQEIMQLGVVMQADLISDGPLSPEELSMATVEDIIQAGPWGQHFPEPSFDNIFRVIEQKIVGQHHLKLLVQDLRDSKYFDAMVFNVDKDQWPNHRARFIHALYHLDINEFQGRRHLQLLIRELEPVTEECLTEWV